MDLKKVGAKESDIPTDTEDIPSEWLSSSALRDDRDLLIPRTPWQESESE